MNNRQLELNIPLRPNEGRGDLGNDEIGDRWIGDGGKVRLSRRVMGGKVRLSRLVMGGLVMRGLVRLSGPVMGGQMR